MGGGEQIVYDDQDDYSRKEPLFCIICAELNMAIELHSNKKVPLCGLSTIYDTHANLYKYII